MRFEEETAENTASAQKAATTAAEISARAAEQGYKSISSDVRANWLEQLNNGAARAVFFVGIFPIRAMITP